MDSCYSDDYIVRASSHIDIITCNVEEHHNRIFALERSIINTCNWRGGGGLNMLLFSLLFFFPLVNGFDKYFRITFCVNDFIVSGISRI